MRFDKVLDVLCSQILLLSVLLIFKSLHIFLTVAIWINGLHEESQLNSGSLYVFLNLLPKQLIIVILLPPAVGLLR